MGDGGQRGGDLARLPCMEPMNDGGSLAPFFCGRMGKWDRTSHNKRWLATQPSGCSAQLAHARCVSGSKLGILVAVGYAVPTERQFGNQGTLYAIARLTEWVSDGKGPLHS